VSQSAFGEAGLERVREGLERGVAAGIVPGAVGLVARGDEVVTFTAGTTEVGGDQPVRRDTIFRIASMTKPIVAAAVMMLVDDGRLQLDEPVDRLLPELSDRRVLRSLDAEIDDTVPAERPITVRHLLTNQMGLGVVLPMGAYPLHRAVDALGISSFGMPDPGTEFDNDEQMRRLGTLPLFVQPGTDWLYNTASDVQGVLVARASGQSLGRFLEERIFGPLGMADTAFHVPPGKQDRFVPANRVVDGRLVPFDSPTTGGWTRPPLFEQGHSGLVSTVDDYRQFGRLLLDGGRHGGRALLSPAAIAAMTTNQLTAAQRASGAPFLRPSYGWSFGFAVTVAPDIDGPGPGALTWSGGFGTSWVSDPATGLTVILLTSRLAEAAGRRAVHAEFQADSFAALR
jgi:CubicO group peptidase (beta-lactamase class C family)